MSHRIALVLGQITIDQYNDLERLKKEDPAAYHDYEHKLGASREQLVSKFGPLAVQLGEGAERINPQWLTNRSTGNKFRRR